MRNKGFTLIEMVLVIAILGILAVAAMPSLFNISLTSARTNAMNATVGAVQTGITLFGANQLNTTGAISYPATLDSVTGTAGGTAATNLAPLFTGVLQNGVSAQWFKLVGTAGTFVYAYDTNGNASYSSAADTCFTYTIASGTFLQTACP
jgi:prepilin-type N-terminal cleavage/methylation domain-containing protein